MLLLHYNSRKHRERNPKSFKTVKIKPTSLKMGKTAKDLFLENQVCFPLYACSRALTAIYRPILEELGITYPQYLVLLILWKEDGCSVKEIGKKLYLDSGTLTPLLKRLEDSEFVIRRRSIEDERSVEIYLSAKGKNLEIRLFVFLQN